MSQIRINNLTYRYDTNSENVFEKISLSIDTNWKLGFIGRNGKGKTTLLKILTGEYKYSGTIVSDTTFDYFPYKISNLDNLKTSSELIDEIKPGCEHWKVICELEKLNAEADILYRPYNSLSYGERTKVFLSILFSGDNEFLLIDEPTNHLDYESRMAVRKYLADKKGFILVSHDRELLDSCVDHVLVLNRESVEIQKGNFSTWWKNKEKKDKFVNAENQKHILEIKDLRKSVQQSGRWATKNENSKIGFNPTKEPERNIATRAYIGAKTKKMQKRIKSYEKRIEREIKQKEGLINDIEEIKKIKMSSINHHKDTLIFTKQLSLKYSKEEKMVINDLDFELKQGERIFLKGNNGCGKSTLIKYLLAQINKQDSDKNSNQNSDTNTKLNNKQNDSQEIIKIKGEVNIASGLIISYVNQNTDFLTGSFDDYCEKKSLEKNILFTILNQLDIVRGHFNNNLEMLSEGQKKKVLLAASIMTPAHLYIWDEPLNYIDVFSRMQIEELIMMYKPTMILVDHDTTFRQKIASRTIEL